MLEALSAEATETSLKAYYDYTCRKGKSYDDKNIKMLKVINRSIYYDPMDQYNFTNSLYIRCWEIARSKENVFNNAQTLNHQKQTLEENFETLKSQLGG